MTTPPPVCNEESLRWDSPSRMAGRITIRDVAIEDYVIPKGERFEPAGEPEPWMTTIGHGPAKLPLRILAAGNG